MKGKILRCFLNPGVLCAFLQDLLSCSVQLFEPILGKLFKLSSFDSKFPRVLFCAFKRTDQIGNPSLEMREDKEKRYKSLKQSCLLIVKTLLVFLKDSSYSIPP